ncbi:unnamed protein product, partial [Ectocarpus fasciculatus]
ERTRSSFAAKEYLPVAIDARPWCFTVDDDDGWMVPHMSVSVCVLFFFVVRGCVSGGWPSSRSGTGGGGGAKGPAWLHACLVERHCLLVLPTPLGVKNVFLVLLGARGWAEDT